MTTPSRRGRLSYSAPNSSDAVKINRVTSLRVSTSNSHPFLRAKSSSSGEHPLSPSKTQHLFCAGSPVSPSPWRRLESELPSLDTCTSLSLEDCPILETSFGFNSNSAHRKETAHSRDAIVHVFALEAMDISNTETIAHSEIGQAFEKDDALFPISTPLLTDKSSTSPSPLDVDEMENPWWETSLAEPIQNAVATEQQGPGCVSNESSPVQRELERMSYDGTIERIRVIIKKSGVSRVPTHVVQGPIGMPALVVPESNYGILKGRLVDNSTKKLSENSTSTSMHNATSNADEQDLNDIEEELVQLTAEHRNNKNRKLLWDQIDNAASPSLRALIAGTKKMPCHNNNITLLLVRPQAMSQFRLQQRAARICRLSRSVRSLEQNVTSPLVTDRDMIQIAQKNKRPRVLLAVESHSKNDHCRKCSNRVVAAVNMQITIKGIRWGVPLSALVAENILDPILAKSSAF